MRLETDGGTLDDAWAFRGGAEPPFALFSDGVPPQQHPLAFRIDRDAPVALADVRPISSAVSPRPDEAEGDRCGTLVLSGNMAETGGATPRRKAAVVLEPDEGAARVPIDLRAVAAVEAHTAGEDHVYHGWLTPHRAVFYVEPTAGGAVRQFGFSPFFPLRYLDAEAGDATLASVRPEMHRTDARLDVAESLFGFRLSGERSAAPRSDGHREWSAYRGRVRVEDGFLEPGQPMDVVASASWVPRVLASPKATSPGLVLAQSREALDPASLIHFAEPGARPAGFKRYWHQGRGRPGDGSPAVVSAWERHVSETQPDAVRAMRALESWTRQGPYEAELDTQHTLMRPVRPGVRFRFRVHYEGLSDVELGALLWAIVPRQSAAEPLRIAHHVGMGKPLGMGSVRLEAVAVASSRPARYATFFDEAGGVEAGERPGVELTPTVGVVPLGDVGEDVKDVRIAYERHVWGALSRRDAEEFAGLPHVRALLRMMSWPGRRAVPYRATSGGNAEERESHGRVLIDGAGDAGSNTRYMHIELPGVDENEFRKEPVLLPATDPLYETIETASREAWSDPQPDAGRGRRGGHRRTR